MVSAANPAAKAAQTVKGNAPNLYYLSISMDTDGIPSKSVVNAGTAAATLAPSVPEYALHAALVNLRAGDKNTAIRVLQPFANNPHDLEYAAKVAALINELDKTQDLSESLAKLEKLGLPPKKDEEKGKEKGKDKEERKEDK
jgi:hypothetical protein